MKPKFARVNGYWKDDKSKFKDYLIKLSLDIEEDEDDQIFFYVDGERELNELTSEESSDEFVVTNYKLQY